jgi:hypothetical protein
VFLSGLLVGALYGRRMDRNGFAGPARQIWKRAFELYLWTLGLMVAVLVLRQVLPGAAVIWTRAGLLPTLSAPVTVAAAALLYQPTFFDILPYILYMAVAPFLLWLCITGRAASSWPDPAFLWLAMQLGMHLAIAEGSTSSSACRLRADAPARLQPLAWQILFFSAMAIGALWAQGRVGVGRILTRPARRPRSSPRRSSLFAFGGSASRSTCCRG